MASGESGASLSSDWGQPINRLEGGGGGGGWGGDLRGGMQAWSSRIATCGKVSRSTAQNCDRGTTQVGPISAPTSSLREICHATHGRSPLPAKDNGGKGGRLANRDVLGIVEV